MVVIFRQDRQFHNRVFREYPWTWSVIYDLLVVEDYQVCIPRRLVAICRPLYSFRDYDKVYLLEVKFEVHIIARYPSRPMFAKEFWLVIFPDANGIKPVCVVCRFRFRLHIIGGRFKIASSTAVGVVVTTPVILKQPSLWICACSFLLFAKFSMGQQTMQACIKMSFIMVVYI